jgi:GTPase SAR1 family protein
MISEVENLELRATGGVWRLDATGGPSDPDPIPVHLCELISSEEYSAMRYMYHKKASAFLMCFNVNSRSCFDELPGLHEEIERGRDVVLDQHYDWRKDSNAEATTMLLVGACADEQGDDGRVDPQQAIEFARAHGYIGYVETSAKENVHLNTALELVVRVDRIRRALRGAHSSGGAGTGKGRRSRLRRLLSRQKSVSTTADDNSEPAEAPAGRHTQAAPFIDWDVFQDAGAAPTADPNGDHEDVPTSVSAAGEGVVPDLKTLCQRLLIDSITDTNAVTLFLEAEHHDAQLLADSSSTYAEHRWFDILESEASDRKTEHSNFVRELPQRVYDRCHSAATRQREAQMRLEGELALPSPFFVVLYGDEAPWANCTQDKV